MRSKAEIQTNKQKTVLVPHEACLIHPYKGPHRDVRTSSPTQGQRTRAPDLFPRGRSALPQALFHPGTFLTMVDGALCGAAVREATAGTTAPTPGIVQVLPGTQLCPGGSGQTPRAQLLPPNPATLAGTAALTLQGSFFTPLPPLP